MITANRLIPNKDLEPLPQTEHIEISINNDLKQIAIKIKNDMENNTKLLRKMYNIMEDKTDRYLLLVMVLIMLIFTCLTWAILEKTLGKFD